MKKRLENLVPKLRNDSHDTASPQPVATSVAIPVRSNNNNNNNNHWLPPSASSSPIMVERKTSFQEELVPRAASASPRARKLSAQLTTLAYEDVLRNNSNEQLAPGPLSPGSQRRRARANSIISSGEYGSALMRVLQNRDNPLSSRSDGGGSTTAPGQDAEPAAPGTQRSVLTVDRSQRLPVLDYMCVCGLSKPGETVQPKLLAYAPLSATVERQLSLFCFPDQPPQYRPAHLNAELLQSDLAALRHGTNQFWFCLSANTATPTYVFVMRTWEVLEQPPPWMPPGAIEAASLVAQRNVTQRAYCIVSRNPYARLMWDLLYHMIRFERERLTTADEDKRRRAEGRQRALLTIIEGLASQRASPGGKIELTSRACFPGGQLCFQMPDATHSLRVSVAAVCLPALMRAFSPQNLTLLLCALLIEAKVVFVGRTAGRVSACVMALAAAMAPFAWQACMMPLVPHHMMDLFDAPVPLLCGRVTHELSATWWRQHVQVGAGSTMVVAVVDTNEVHVIGSALPNMPEWIQLAQNLHEAHMWLRASRRVSNQMCEDDTPFAELNDRDASHVFSAIEALNQYTVWLLSAVRRLLPGNAYTYEEVAGGICNAPDNPALCAELLKQMKPESHEFMDLLFNSQHYQAIATTFGDMPPLDDDDGVGSAYEGCRL